MLKLKSMPCAIAWVIASGALAGAVPALAQTQSDPAAAPQRVVVTGSLISRSDLETPAPIQVLTAEDIAKTGKTSIAEILSDLSANGQGTLGSGFSGAFANGGAGVSLRGLTVGATLVLIDGHRMAPYPLSDDAQRSFVDVSSIPVDLIERIDVLKSGASATYGSDAVAGVVNIILKKSFNGTRVSAEGGNAQHGGGDTKKASITSGYGDLDADGFNVFVSAEYRKQDAIRIADRANFDWANGDWRGRGGNDLRRGVPTSLNSFLTPASSPFLFNPTGAGGTANAANFQFLDSNCNYQKYMAGGCAVEDTVSFIQPETENFNILVGATKKLWNDWELSLKGSMFRRETLNNRGLTAANAYSPISFGGNTALVPGQNPQTVNVYGSTQFPVGHPLNPFGSPARLYGYIPGMDPAATQDNTSKTLRFSADLTGSAYGWDIVAALGSSEVKIDNGYSGYVNRAALYQALNRAVNPFNPLGGNSAADNATILPRFNNETVSRLHFAELRGSRELMQLAGGPLALATGVSWHKRTTDAPPPGLLANGIVGNGTQYVFGEETNTAVFAELSAAPIKNVEVGASARYDHYDTYGNSFTPSAQFKWKVAPVATLRGTFARGFRAPNAAEVGTASSLFSFNAINDPILCANGDRNTPGNVPAACGFTPAFVQITTPDLSPEKSKSFTFGAIIEPVKDLSATVDYYQIHVKNQINTAAGFADFVPDFVRNQVFPVDIRQPDGSLAQGIPSVGTVAYATSGYINSGSTKTRGIDLDLSYRLRMGSYGNLRAALSVNHMISYEIETAGKSYELAGTHGPSVISGNTGNPKNRAQLSLNWDRGPLGVTTSLNYTGDYSALDPSLGATDCSSVDGDVGGRTYFSGIPGGVPLSYCRIPSFTSTNLNMTYKVNPNLTLRASVLNVFDKQPPIDVATYGNANNLTSYNASLHQAGAIGRYFSLGANYTF